ncbi:MAG: hypothetical protein A2007_03815 [Verrucomicrobia bacterium GWC2_42_7]|nr:MAG: hypothetical protein A2007_03815 [Verrucomicrobia bacterium GWC2_42_7]
MVQFEYLPKYLRFSENRAFTGVFLKKFVFAYLHATVSFSEGVRGNAFGGPKAVPPTLLLF